MTSVWVAQDRPKADQGMELTLNTLHSRAPPWSSTQTRSLRRSESLSKYTITSHIAPIYSRQEIIQWAGWVETTSKEWGLQRLPQLSLQTRKLEPKTLSRPHPLQRKSRPRTKFNSQCLHRKRLSRRRTLRRLECRKEVLATRSTPAVIMQSNNLHSVSHVEIFSSTVARSGKDLRGGHKRIPMPSTRPSSW